MNLVKIIILLFSVSTFSQITSEYKKFKEEHPNSHSVRLTQETTVTIALHKGELIVTEDIYKEDMYLDESATHNSKQALTFSSFYELDNIEASSFILKDDKYEEIKVKEFKEKDELDNSFYDDTKSLNFIYSNLNQGSKTKLKYSQKIKNARFLNAFFFANFQPIIHNKFTIIVDKDVQLIFQEFNMEGLPIEFTQSSNKKNNIYSWQINDVNEIEYEENAPTYKSILPHIIPRISSYTVNGEQQKLLENTADLYDWYFSLVQNINRETDNPDLVALVQDLTMDKANDLEKAKAIYYWTQENIKYIAFEYALGGFVPREANDVFEKKYGDCKDNSSILYKMLEIAGIKGNLTWIGTRSLPYTYKDVPTPLVDNHMILSFEYEGETYYLDATGRYTPIEMPTSFIQGKEALVAIDAENFEVKTVPVIAPEKNAVIETSFITLEGNSLMGNSITKISGYPKTDLLYQLERKTTETKILEFYNALFQKGNNSFLIKNIVEEHKNIYDKNLVINYDFSISNAAKSVGDEMYINLNLNREITTLKTKENRIQPVELEYKNQYEYHTTFQIPEGYKISYIPKNTQVSNGYVSCSINYRVEEDNIYYHYRTTVDALLLDLNAQKEVNTLIDKIEQDFKEVIVLKKI